MDEEKNTAQAENSTETDVNNEGAGTESDSHADLDFILDIRIFLTLRTAGHVLLDKLYHAGWSHGLILDMQIPLLGQSQQSFTLHNILLMLTWD